MKESFDIVVVIPVGPNTPPEFVKDTIESYLFYTRANSKIIIADDSHQGIGKEIKNAFPGTDVITSAKPMGGWAGLYINEATAFQHAVVSYNFKALLKLDTDALVIGPDPEKEALELMERIPEIGMMGQYPNCYDGQPWDIGWPRDRVLNGATTWRYIRRPITNWYLRKLYLKAVGNNYRAGESVFGGAYFMSYACLSKLYKEGLLPHKKLIGLNMGEDHIFSLLVKSIGFHFGSLSGYGKPFALAWKGLPASPEQLYKEGRKFVHSTKSWNGMDEKQIRELFKQKREAVPLVTTQPALTIHG